MPHREFRTPDGRRWRVWLVQPKETFGERRGGADRRCVSIDDLDDPPVLERRRGPERRIETTPRLKAVLPEPWNAGWLVFEAERQPPHDAREARRLAPVPKDWSVCPEARLAALLERARLAGGVAN